MTAPAGLYVSLERIPTKCLQAIQIANDRFKEFGHDWRDCIFGTAVQVHTGQVCVGSTHAAQAFNFNEDEKSAMKWIYTNWDATKFSQEDLMKAIETTLKIRADNADVVTYEKSGRTVKEVVTIKRGAPKLDTITDADIYDWLYSLPKETVDA